MSVRIVTHCYAEELPQYATQLRFHLSSFVLYKPKTIPVTVEICMTATDKRTRSVFRWFRDHTDLDLEHRILTKPEMFRRGVGRNRAALQNKEDVVWFTDVDHVFHEGCLDAMWEQWKLVRDRDPRVLLIYPRRIQIQSSGEAGDKLIKRMEKRKIELVDIDTSDFVRKRYTRGIGGVQIVSGRFCRDYGYLDGWKAWALPRDDGVAFGDFRDDRAFRIELLKRGKIQYVYFPGVFRLRHTERTHP